EDDDGPRHKVLDEDDVPLRPPLDLSHLPEDARMRALDDELEALTPVPFHLGRAPRFRARLHRLAEDDHVLYFMTHHVNWAGWSFEILYAEMSALYEAFAAGRPSPLPPLETTYTEYAAWRADALAGGAVDRHLEFWKRHLDGATEP